MLQRATVTHLLRGLREPWQNSSPYSLQNISVTGTCLSLFSYWPIGLLSTSCTPALLMLGRTPAEMAFVKPPDTPVPPAVPPGSPRNTPGGSRTRWSQLMLLPVNSYRKQGQESKELWLEDLVWVYSPRRKKGRYPKLDCYWVGPCKVLGKLVYQVQLPQPRGR